MKTALAMFLGVYCMALGACVNYRTDNFDWGHKAIQYCDRGHCK